MPSFDIIITSFNRLAYLKRTVASLLASGAYGKAQRIIIVDNHSTEEGLEPFLNELATFKNTFVIRRPTNDGWATAVNDALGLSRGEYVLLSNNDVEYQVGFIESLFKTFNTFENNPIGIMGVWRHTSHGYTKNGWTSNDFREMDNVPAVGWLMPKKAMEKVGMLDEKGPCFTKGGNGEDTDYVMRMKGAGYLVGVPTEDVATHMDGY